MNFTMACEVRDVTPHTHLKENPITNSSTYALLVICKSHQWFPKFGLKTSNISITWGLIKNANVRFYPRPIESRLWAYHSSLTSPPDDSDISQSLGTTATNWFTEFAYRLNARRSRGMYDVSQVSKCSLMISKLNHWWIKASWSMLSILLRIFMETGLICRLYTSYHSIAMHTNIP